MSIFAAPVYSLEGIVFYRKGNYAKEWIFFEIGKISYSLGKIVLILSRYFLNSSEIISSTSSNV